MSQENYKLFSKIFSLLFYSAILVALVAPSTASAIGVTPPYFKNNSLTRNSIYQQQIILVRGDADEDLEAQITLDVPGANNWITIDKGLRFIFPKGEKQFPIMVKAVIPDDASFGTYTGNFRVVFAPPGGPEAGTVTIALGLQIDIELKVIDKKIIDFTFRGVNILDAEEGHKVWWLDFPGKIKFYVRIENIGNVSSAPSKVEFDIYDIYGNLVESTANTNEPILVKPFAFGDVLYELPTWLKPGRYPVKYRIYKEGELFREDETHLSLLAYKTLPDYEGYGLLGLSLGDKLSLVSILLAIFAVFFFGVVWLKRNRKRLFSKIAEVS